MHPEGARRARGDRDASAARSGGWTIEFDGVPERAKLSEGTALDVLGAQIAQCLGAWIVGEVQSSATTRFTARARL